MVSGDHSSHFLFDGSKLCFEVSVVKACGLPAKVKDVSLEGNGTERVRMQGDGACLAGLLGKKTAVQGQGLVAHIRLRGRPTLTCHCGSGRVCKAA